MLTESDDNQLAQLAALGDRAAFARLIERHYERIHRMARRFVGDPAAAEDLAQDVCVQLARRILSFRGEARFTTWLYKVVLNAVRDRARRAKARATATAGFAEVDTLRRAGDAARADEAAWLRAALDSLSPELRETVVLTLDEGLSHAEAGAILGVAESTISWRLMTVRKHLKSLADAGEGLEQ